jgi:hypothetical protein
MPDEVQQRAGQSALLWLVDDRPATVSRGRSRGAIDYRGTTARSACPVTYSAWARSSRSPPRVAGRSAPGSTAALIYRVIHGTPGLDDSPADLRARFGRCLAKNPADGQTAQDLLAELGDTELTKGWLPAPAVKETPGPADPGWSGTSRHSHAGTSSRSYGPRVTWPASR